MQEAFSKKEQQRSFMILMHGYCGISIRQWTHPESCWISYA